MQPHNFSPIFSEFSDDADMADLVQEFVAALVDRVASLEQACAENKVSEISRLAHQLKGASGGYGFAIIGQAAASLETASKSAVSTDEVRAQVDELISLCKRATATPAS